MQNFAVDFFLGFCCVQHFLALHIGYWTGLPRVTKGMSSRTCSGIQVK